MQRIEGFKNSMHRDELLRLGDEAMSELQAAAEGQFVLTEILMLESVDRIIMKRLAIRSYRRWRRQLLELRTAQRQPIHWGLEPGCPVASLLPRIEPEDVALVVGAGVEACTYLLAAHDVSVSFIAGEIGCVERVEARMADEALGTMFSAWVVHLGHWLPDFDQPLDVLVLDVSALADLDAARRCQLIHTLQERTGNGGAHVLSVGSEALAPQALLSLYEGWTTERNDTKRRGHRGPKRAIVLTKPATRAEHLP